MSKMLPAVGSPRYVRVNTLLSSIEDVIEIFQAEGWQLDVTPDSYQAFLQSVSNLSEDHFIQDLHMKELLIFPKRTEFFHHHLYQNGSIFLQNKEHIKSVTDNEVRNLLNLGTCGLHVVHGSLITDSPAPRALFIQLTGCTTFLLKFYAAWWLENATLLPVYLLDPRPNSVVLDMCAAPGMKTTHIAAKMSNKGTIYAVEKNPSRYETLCELVQKSGAISVKTIRNDVLMVDSSNCPDVEYILVDPSCSGTGIVDRVSMYPEEKCSSERLQGLAYFQVILLEHALSKFPNVKRVVYSTCSLNVEENEEVVEKALSYTKANPSNPQFRLASNLLKGSWVSRGSTHYQHGAHTLYARPETDLTNGFFIAVFDRIEDTPKKYENKILKHTNQVDLEMTKCKRSKNEENGVKLSSQKYKTPTAEKKVKTINKVNDKEIKLVELDDDDDAVLSNKKRKRNTSDRDEELKYYNSIKKKLTKGQKLSDLEIQSVVGLINKQNSKQKKRKKQ
uniref:SAM-dependent MTase RsmB/NOP-type domain-containing protein n=1 Tax=Timema poppense TaxID=170557 RepID=A0A7R9H7I5_TIMPO|nr:unnamed protein product [Timema poppensis]